MATPEAYMACSSCIVHSRCSANLSLSVGLDWIASMARAMPPSMAGDMHGYGRPGGNVTMASQSSDEFHQGDIDLYGDIPEGKRRKFILVDDPQKSARVRVKVTLDQIEMSEIPDSYRKNNSVFPRAYLEVILISFALPDSRG